MNQGLWCTKMGYGKMVFGGLFFLYFFALPSQQSSDLVLENLLSGANQKTPLIIDASLHQYLVKRLASAVELVPAIEKKACFLPFPRANQLGLAHPEMIYCVQQITEEKSLKSVHKAWKKFLSHNFDTEPLFLREFLLTLITLNANTSCLLKTSFNEMDIFLPSESTPTHGQSWNWGGQQPDQPLLQKLVDLYHALNYLPILDLLAIIDNMTTQVHWLIQTYEMHSTLTWAQWGARYWWFIPVALLACARIIIKRLTTYSYLHIYRAPHA
jgi:hypothetical protein